MSSQAKSFSKYSMQSNSNDKKQQPIASGFPGSNLYQNQNIWNSSFNSARERSKDVEQAPSGSSALNANSEATAWGARNWKTEKPSRSTNSSPNQKRDVGLQNGPNYYEPTQHAIGAKVNGYTSTYGSQNRGSQEAPYVDRSGFGTSREHGIPPSRQSQGSPAFSEMYGHTPTNSIQSQRPAPSQSSSFQNQAANQLAFQYNNTQVDDELSHQFNSRLNLENGGSAFNPNSQPFQMNPGPQTWSGETLSRFNPVDLPADALSTMVQAVTRGSAERIAPSSAYRLEQNSPRGYAVGPDPWTRPSSRGQRLEQERRGTSQMHHAFQAAPYYNQYPYNYSAQYPANLLESYPQNFRPSMVPGYGMSHMQYPVPGNYSIRPPQPQDPSKSVRSVLLEEFRLNNKSSKRYELKDIYDHVVEFSGDQHGSRFIQQKLETANSDEKEQIFREIEPNAVQLMKDVFGNYVIQKIFEHGNQVQKKILAEKMRGKVVDLSVQVYACRVVQKALEHVLVEQQAELTRELEPDVLKVISDANGNHVVQKIIELVPRQYIDFIMNAVRGQVVTLASHSYGCRVIQRMLEHGTGPDKAEMMTELHSSARHLINDQYGNYVAQHVIQNGNPQDREKIIQLVLNDLVLFSKHKFASNVVEKCIENGSPEQRTHIRQQLTTAGSDGVNPLSAMIRDQYGNYVIQKLLSQLEDQERELLVEEIKPQFFLMKKNSTSRQIQALEKLLGLSGTNGVNGNVVRAGSSANSPNNTLTNSPQTNGLGSINGEPDNDAFLGERSSSHTSSNGITTGVSIDKA